MYVSGDMAEVKDGVGLGGVAFAARGRGRSAGLVVASTGLREI